MAAVVALIGALLCYSAGNLFQSWAAGWAERRGGLDPGLLPRLFADPLYVVGFGFQAAGFALAFLASARLPLYLVQSALAASVTVTVVVGALLLGWRLRSGEVAALVAVIVGLILIGESAVPSVPAELNPTIAPALIGVVVVIAVLSIPASRLSEGRSAVALGVLAGVGFAMVALLARPLAAGPLLELPLQPSFWVLVVAAIVSQALFAMSLQRGTARAIAATPGASMILAAIAGVVLLGDQIATGRYVMVVSGLLLVIIGIVALAAIVGGGGRRAHRDSRDGSVTTGRTA